MKTLHIVLCLIEQDNKWHLQLRDGDPKIGAAGLIGGFGGKVEPDEDPLLAICRELSEETSLVPMTDSVKPLGIVEVISDHQFELIKAVAHTYHLILDSNIEVIAREGQLVTIHKSETYDHLHRMTPGTRACFEQYILENV